MTPEDLPREPEAPQVSHPRVEELTEAEIEALEDAEDLRVARERRNEETVSWESIKAKHGL